MIDIVTCLTSDVQKWLTEFVGDCYHVLADPINPSNNLCSVCNQHVSIRKSGSINEPVHTDFTMYEWPIQWFRVWDMIVDDVDFPTFWAGVIIRYGATMDYIGPILLWEVYCWKRENVPLTCNDEIIVLTEENNITVYDLANVLWESAWTIVDPNSRYVLTRNYLTVNDLPRSETAAIYKDLGKGFVSGDFIYDIGPINVISGTDNGKFVFFSLTKDICESHDPSFDQLVFQIYFNAGILEAKFSEMYGGIQSDSTIVTPLSIATDYFVTITRIAGAVKMSVYDDVARTSLIGESTIALASVEMYKYLYIARSWNDGDANIINATFNFPDFAYDGVSIFEMSAALIYDVAIPDVVPIEDMPVVEAVLGILSDLCTDVYTLYEVTQLTEVLTIAISEILLDESANATDTVVVTDAAGYDAY